MKTKEELNALKEEVETLNKKLCELSEDELKQVVGGSTGMASTGYIQLGVRVGQCPNCGGVLRADYEHDTSLFWEISCQDRCGYYNNQGLTREQVKALYG